jgi:hypothetical protein
MDRRRVDPCSLFASQLDCGLLAARTISQSSQEATKSSTARDQRQQRLKQ